MKKANMFIIAIMALVIINCNGNDSDNPDAGDTDTTSATCADVADILPNATFRVCIDDPNHGDIPIDIENAPTELLNRINKEKSKIQAGSYDKCHVVLIRGAEGATSDAFTTDEDGAEVDANNPTHKSLTGIHIDSFACDNPVDEFGAFIQSPPLKDFILFFDDVFATMMKWFEGTAEFIIVSPTVINPDGFIGSAYESKEFSSAYFFNRPFNQFEVNYVTDGEGGYDVNEDGVLFQVTLSDEEQEQVPNWVVFEAKEGETSLEITPVTGEPTQFRVKVSDTGEHTITITVNDTNNIISEETDQHSATVEDSIDLTEDLCEGVTCGSNATCDPSDGLCYCDPGYDGDGETCVCDTASGYYDDGLGGCVNPCDADPCGLTEHGATCTPTDFDTYTCTCDVGYTPASDCTSCDTTGGYVENPLDTSECIDDPCLPDPCNGHASSCDVEGPSDYTCNCTGGWTGDDCEIPPLPTGSIALDCSGGSAPGWCMNNEHYPLVITSTNANTFTASQTLNCGSDGTFTPTTGSVTGSPMDIDFVSPCGGPITIQVELCNTTGCIYPTSDETIN